MEIWFCCIIEQQKYDSIVQLYNEIMFSLFFLHLLQKITKIWFYCLMWKPMFLLKKKNKKATKCWEINK